MDIREKIYKEIANQGGIGYPENESVAKRLSEADTRLLVQDMDQFYTQWFAIQELQEENFDEARCDLEYIQESSFEIVCQALALKGDSNIIPYFLKYVPVDGRKRANHQVVMEDYNTQNLIQCIDGAEYYGESYIPVLLSHIHELIPDKMIEARGMLYNMLWDDLNTFASTHPFFTNLFLAKKEQFLCLLDHCMEQTLSSLQKKNPEKVKEVLQTISKTIEGIAPDTEGVVQIAYVRQEFLKLHAAD